MRVFKKNFKRKNPKTKRVHFHYPGVTDLYKREILVEKMIKRSFSGVMPPPSGRLFYIDFTYD